MITTSRRIRQHQRMSGIRSAYSTTLPQPWSVSRNSLGKIYQGLPSSRVERRPRVLKAKWTCQGFLDDAALLATLEGVT